MEPKNENQNIERKPVPKSQSKNLITTNRHFRNARYKDLTLELMWSERRQMHMCIVKKPVAGMIFEDGVFISGKNLERDLKHTELNDKEFDFYIMGLKVLGNDTLEVLSEARYQQILESTRYTAGTVSKPKKGKAKPSQVKDPDQVNLFDKKGSKK